MIFFLSAAVLHQVVDFKDLQQFLPQGELDGYVRGKMSGETSTIMGFTSSWAEVAYSARTDKNRAGISIKITDMLNIPSYMSIPISPSDSSNHQMLSAHKNTVVHKKMSVFETSDSTLHQARLQTAVATRFLIEINGNGISLADSLYPFLDSTDVEGLKKIAETGGINTER